MSWLPAFGLPQLTKQINKGETIPHPPECRII